MKPFDKIQAKDSELNRVQDNVLKALNPALANPLLDGRLIDVTLVATGATTLVAHGLGRAPIGWFLARLTSGVMVWEVATQARPELFLELEQTGASPVDVKVYVF